MKVCHQVPAVSIVRPLPIDDSEVALTLLNR